MNKNEIQNYLDEKFPELKFMICQDPHEARGNIIRLKTNIQIKFYLMPKFNDSEKHNLLLHIEDMLYKELGLLNKALDDVRKIKRELI